MAEREREQIVHAERERNGLGVHDKEAECENVARYNEKERDREVAVEDLDQHAQPRDGGIAAETFFFE